MAEEEEIIETAQDIPPEKTENAPAVQEIRPQDIAQIADDWIRNSGSLQQVLVNTAQLVNLIPEQQFDDIGLQLSSVLQNATDSQGNRFFKSQQAAFDFLKSLRNRKTSNPKKMGKNTNIKREISTETIYSREISPMMRRKILSDITPTFNVFE